MHVLTLVFLSPRVTDVSAYLDDIFTDNTSERRFPTFRVECSCIGSVARAAGYDAFDSSPRGVVVLALLKDARNAKDADAERELLRERSAFARAVEMVHPDNGLVDPACDICGGSGALEQSRDPSKHVDWWSVGGRWDGLFLSGGNTGESTIDSPLEANTVPAAAVPAEVVPAAIVSPEGHWYEPPLQYSFLDPADATPDQLSVITNWRAAVHELLVTHYDCRVVLLDCHT